MSLEPHADAAAEIVTFHMYYMPHSLYLKMHGNNYFVILVRILLFGFHEGAVQVLASTSSTIFPCRPMHAGQGNQVVYFSDHFGNETRKQDDWRLHKKLVNSLKSVAIPNQLRWRLHAVYSCS